MKRHRWAVFISGTGSNLGALLDMRGFVDIGVVISSSPKAFGLLKARRAGVPTLVLPKPIDWNSLLQELRAHNIDSIFLAGFMKIVPEAFISGFWGKILNLHPSQLPAYPGLHSIEKAFTDGVDSGCTIHHVVPEVDSGPTVFQRRVIRESKLEQTEFMVHLSEQRLVREAVVKC